MFKRLIFALFILSFAKFSETLFDFSDASSKVGRTFDTSTISGQVINKTTLAPISGAAVDLYRSQGLGNAVFSAHTDETGSYQFTNVVPDTYFVVFSATGYAQEFYPNQLSVAFAAPIAVSNGTSQTVDGHLGKLRSLKGIIRDGVTRLPAPGVNLYLFHPGDQTYFAQRSTNEQGEFAFENVWGLYTLLVGEYTGYQYPERHHAVSVTLDADTWFESSVLYSGSIRGKVIDANTNAPTQGVTVSAYSSDGVYSRMTTTNVQGGYVFDNLPPDNYRVKVGDIGDSSSPGYAYQYFDNQPSFMSATPVEVRPREVTTVNVNLRASGVLSVQVRSKLTGEQLNTLVTVCPAYEFDDRSCKTSTGWFSGLPDAPLNAYVDISVGRDYYSDAINPINANPIQVTNGLTTFITIESYEPAYIKGHVADAQTGTASQTSVVAHDAHAPSIKSADFWGASSTDENGDFIIRPYREDGYKLMFLDGWSLSDGRFFDNKSSWSDANVINITRGQTVFITTSLPHRGAYGGIRGKLVLENGQPFTDSSWIELHDNEPYQSGLNADLNGEFTFANIGPGKYRIKIIPRTLQFPAFYYGLTSSLDQALAITVSEGITTNLLITVPSGIGFSGSYIDSLTQSRQEYVGNQIFDAISNEPLGYVSSDEIGRFQGRVLTPGIYKIQSTGSHYMPGFSRPFTISETGAAGILLSLDGRLCLDPFEPDDSPLRAARIEINKPWQRHSACRDQDIDWLNFDIARSGAFTVETQNSNTYIELYRFEENGKLKLIGFNDDISPFSDTRSKLSMWLEHGRYYIKIYSVGMSGAAISYDLSVQYDIRVIGYDQSNFTFLPYLFR
ncbi:MAG TPA: carboxypeptidase regulatory-like domain-containing protein [Thermoflexales bacterium]|nr:carboxypeptidase regulatory-like domain-containing protein [Thermoflexales bacterium]HQW33977.1 carboxypeptidase regulatory-like domain-containing protein [Thermoflexales bacterium]